MSWLSSAVADFVKLIEGDAPQVAADLTAAASAAEAALQPKIDAKVAAGVALGLAAALGQALGAMIAKPVMVAGADPLASTAVRVSATCIAQYVLLWSGFSAARSVQPPTLRVLGWVALIGFIGMGVGMSLILMALKHGDIGMVGILSSVSPVLVLPLLWLRLGRSPARGAWIGASLTVFGTALVLLR